MSWLGVRRVTLAECDSTSDEAAALARSGAPHGTIVTAHAQRAGRGRLGRTWYSPPGRNLYLSCVLRPHLEPRLVPPITLAAGLGVWETVNSAGVDASLKWPNDVLAGGRKLAGILTEMSTRGAEVDHVILGIGINLDDGEFPGELARAATSVARERSAPVDHQAFTDELLASLETWLDRFFAGGVGAIAADWLARARLGRVRVHLPAGGGTRSGRAIGLGEDGALEVRADDGTVIQVVAGDVELASEDAP